MTMFDYLEAYAALAEASLEEMAALEAALADPMIGELETTSPADAWLSGHEFAGEAEIGGLPMVSGTFDPSGEGNDVIMVDGEVLNLPPY